MTDRETILGLRVLVTNAAAQIQRLHHEMTLGVASQKQAEIAQKACEVASMALTEAAPTLRKLARKPVTS